MNKHQIIARGERQTNRKKSKTTQSSHDHKCNVQLHTQGKTITTETWGQRTQHEEKVEKDVCQVIPIFTFEKVWSLFSYVQFILNKHSMFLHFRKHYELNSSKTYIQACLAQNTEPSSLSKITGISKWI